MARSKSTTSASTPSPDTAKGRDATGAAAADRPYVVLARKYRPSSFDDLIGQQAMVTTLRNAFASGRIAQGYMLTGVRGVGKTTTARIIARALNYEREGVDRPTFDMPELGRHCLEIIESRHPDVLEMDAASNTGVDNMREIIESARYKPLLARNKVFIIDEVHMLSKGAFNALLKTLEEPPEHVKFIFATTEIRKVPVTVVSRCQRFDLRRVDVPTLAAHFRRLSEAEQVTAEDEALTLIARSAEGSVRDGLSLLDQAIAIGSGAVTLDGVRSMLGLADRGRIYDLLDRLVGGAAGPAVQALAALNADGAEPAQVLSDLADAVHTATRIKVAGSAGDGVSGEEQRRAGTLAASVPLPLLSRIWQMLLKGLEEVGLAPSPLAAAEMVLIRIAHTADLPSPDEVIRTLSGAAAPARRPAGEGEPRPPSSEGRTVNSLPSAPPAAASPEPPRRQVVTPSPARPPQPEPGFDPGFAPDFDDERDEEVFADEQAIAAPVEPALAPLRSFMDVVALAGARRDARLKIHLEEHVSLVRFDPQGHIELHLMPGAPKEIANELREKLNAWTGGRWMVALSRAPGEPTIGEVARQRAAAELGEVKRHPAVEAVLEQFPDAEITGIRPLPRPRTDETGTG
ncbi:MAG: DNA polymerase III subunit gamma/tau [Hyphomicrobiaceae bacterium]